MQKSTASKHNVASVNAMNTFSNSLSYIAWLVEKLHETVRLNNVVYGDCSSVVVMMKQGSKNPGFFFKAQPGGFLGFFYLNEHITLSAVYVK